MFTAAEVESVLTLVLHDAFTTGLLFALVLLLAWYVPGAYVRALRERSGYREWLAARRAAEEDHAASRL